jgi:hypothetical protein
MMRSFAEVGITYCVCDDRAVFLDIERDRYFCLPSALNKSFVRTVIHGDAMRSADAERLHALGIGALVPGEHAARPNASPLPAREIAPSAPAASPLWAGATHLLVRSRLKRWPFARLIAHERRRRQRRFRETSDQKLAGLHAAFQSASLWIGEADQCLARSIAFRMLAFRLGLAPTLVMGVKLDPFAAHCWVQTDDRVANDSLEHVRGFTPILAI